MKRILAIGHNDLRLFLKHKSAYLWIFVVPLGFIYFLGLATRGPDAPYNRVPSVIIDNQDSGFIGRIFLEELSTQNLRLMNPENRKFAACVIQIPSDLTSRVLRFEPTKIKIIKGENWNESDAALVDARVVRALLALNGHLIEVANATTLRGKPTEEKLHAVIAQPNLVSLDAKFAGRKPVPTGFSFSLPGNLVMYLMMNLLVFGGGTMAAERSSGVIMRLMTYPVARREIVTGKIYGLMLLSFVQIFFFLLVGKFLFHINLGANLPGVLATLLVFAWVASSLGVLVGCLTTSADRVNGICVMASLVMAMLGGCWFSLDFGPPALKTIALFFPTGWALEALHQLISFGSDFSTVLLPIAVLLGFGGAANALATRFFRY